MDLCSSSELSRAKRSCMLLHYDGCNETTACLLSVDSNKYFAKMTAHYLKKAHMTFPLAKNLQDSRGCLFLYLY